MHLDRPAHQVLVYIVCSCLIGLGLNLFRTRPLQFLAKDLELAGPGDEIESMLADPMIREIDLSMAQNFYKSGKLFVDARAMEYFNRGHIPGAMANDDVDALASAIELKIGENAAFIVYCSDDDCGSSEDLAYELQDLGFMNILVFKGGWKEWIGAELPVETNE
jgi:3-mercaptopyruvate sulfurtransferase SseA